MLSKPFKRNNSASRQKHEQSAIELDMIFLNENA